MAPLPDIAEQRGEDVVLQLESGALRWANALIAIVLIGAGLTALAGMGPFAASALGLVGLAMLVDFVRPPTLTLGEDTVRYDSPWPFVSWHVPWEEIVAHEVGWSLSLTREGGSTVTALTLIDGEASTWLGEELDRRLQADPFDRLAHAHELDGRRIDLDGERAALDPMAVAVGAVALLLMAAFVARTSLWMGGLAATLGLAAVLRAWARGREPRRALKVGADAIALMRGEAIEWRVPLLEARVTTSVLDSELVVTGADGEHRVLLPGPRYQRKLVAEALNRAIAAAKADSDDSAAPAAIETLRARPESS